MIARCIIPTENKKARRDTQTLRAVYSKGNPKIFRQPQNPLPGAQDETHLFS